MPLYYGTHGPAKLELDRMATRTMPCEEKAVLPRKVLQAGLVEATIKAFGSSLKACVDAWGKRCKLPSRSA